jgi:hypothetical protein
VQRGHSAPETGLRFGGARGRKLDGGLMGRLTAVECDLLRDTGLKDQEMIGMAAFEEFGLSQGSWVMPRIIHNHQICARTQYVCKAAANRLELS